MKKLLAVALLAGSLMAFGCEKNDDIDDTAPVTPPPAGASADTDADGDVDAADGADTPAP